MIRLKKKLWPLLCVALAIGLSACAGAAKRPGEPTPKSDSALTADEAAVPGPIEAVAATEEEGMPSEASAPPPPAEPAPPLVPSDKPRIVAKVETVQFPAWVERGGIKAAIKAGWAIYTSDRLTTGPDGRLVLGVVGEGRMNIAGGSDVSMTQAYEATGEGPEPPLLRLNRGSMQFSAPLVRAGVPGLPVEIGQGIRADVLGGSLFAMADNNEDLVVLMDGVIRISGDKLNPGTMKTGNTFLRVPRLGRASPVSEASSDRIARWLSGTALLRNRPTAEASGTWDVSLNSGYNLKILETMACRIQGRGFPTEIYPVREPGKQVWYRVVVRRFRSREDALDFLGTARSLGSREPWVLLPQS